MHHICQHFSASKTRYADMGPRIVLLIAKPLLVGLKDGVKTWLLPLMMENYHTVLCLFVV